jgi:hypothetical protein
MIYDILLFGLLFAGFAIAVSKLWAFIASAMGFR